jgi:hypothetical protein
MARLQILELPEGAGDDRPPFILVVDQAPTDETGFDALRRDLGTPDDLLERIGARAVLLFEDTIDIPANDPVPAGDGLSDAQYAEMATTVRRALGIDITEGTPDIAAWLLTACRELEKSEAAREHLKQEHSEARMWAAELDEALARVRNLPTQPELMNAEQEHPSVWLHGYKCGVLAARSATRPRDEEPHHA